MAQLQMLYSEWFDQDLVVRNQVKSPPTIFSLASLGFGGNLSQLFFVIIVFVWSQYDGANNEQ